MLTEREIGLCEKMLQADQRNFHCWNHWMLVTRLMEVPLNSLLAFTMNRINENSSNYSAWHFRGELLHSMLIHSNDGEQSIKTIRDGLFRVFLWELELELNLNALYTECDDQSSWYYMRTLFYIAIELTRKGIIEKDVTSGLFSTRLNELSELMEIAPDCVYGNVFISELKEMSLEIA